MTRYIIIGLFAVAMFLLIGGLDIKLNPFKVALPNWAEAVGFVFLALALAFFNFQSRVSAQKEMLIEMKEELEFIKEHKERIAKYEKSTWRKTR